MAAVKELPIINVYTNWISIRYYLITIVTRDTWEKC